MYQDSSFSKVPLCESTFVLYCTLGLSSQQCVSFVKRQMELENLHIPMVISVEFDVNRRVGPHYWSVKLSE